MGNSFSSPSCICCALGFAAYASWYAFLASVSFCDNSRSVILDFPDAAVCRTTLCMDARLLGEMYACVSDELRETWIALMAACADCAIHGPLGQPSLDDDVPSMISCITSGVLALHEPAAGALVHMARPVATRICRQSDP